MLENYVPDPENYRFVSADQDQRRMRRWHIQHNDAERPLCMNPKFKEEDSTTDEPQGTICKRCVGRADELWEDQ